MKYITVTLLKELREQKGWSQELLAEYSGLSKRTIQRIESGANTTDGFRNSNTLLRSNDLYPH